MTCSRVLALIVAVVTGCVDDVPTLEITTIARVAVELAPADDGIPAAFGHYRWELVEAPPTATDSSPTEETPFVSVEPTTRGLYVYDRWFVSDAAAQLSSHVIVTVTGASPVALVTGPAMLAVGDVATLDGNTSASPEERALEFHWRLSVRAEASTATLANTESSAATFVPDVAGTYSVELRVFDGELWSLPAAFTLVAR